MNCREFRRKHDAYIDDTLSGVELEGMARHRRLCEQCAHLDTRIRRALLVARNLPSIQVSPAFNERLQARLRTERMSLGVNGTSITHRHWYPFSTTAFTAIAAGVIAAAGLAMAVSLSDAQDDVVRLAPVVASRPEAEPSPLMTPTMVAAVPAGMPLWPAVFVAQQAPWHFASDVAAH
ncbi:MAG: hypothetical protein ACXWC3_26670 [Burkholderiales bacterium]